MISQLKRLLADAERAYESTRKYNPVQAVYWQGYVEAIRTALKMLEG